MIVFVASILAASAARASERFGPELAGAAGSDLLFGGWGLSVGPALRIARPVVLLAELEHGLLGEDFDDRLTSVGGGIQLRFAPRSRLGMHATVVVGRDWGYTNGVKGTTSHHLGFGLGLRHRVSRQVWVSAEIRGVVHATDDALGFRAPLRVGINWRPGEERETAGQ